MKDMKWKEYFSKIKKWLFPDEVSAPLKNKEKEISFTYNKPNQGKRIQGHEVRMMSKYPKEGAFRFPLIKDEENIGTVATSKNKIELKKKKGQIKTKIEKDNSQGEKEKFKGRHFSVRTIPSAIHGYQPIHTKTTNDDVQEKDEIETNEEDEIKKVILENNTNLFPVKPKGQSKDIRENEIEAHEEHKVIPFKREKVIKNVVPIKEEKSSEEIEKDENPLFKKVIEENHSMRNASNVRSPSPLQDHLVVDKQEKEIKVESKEQGNYSFPSLSLLNIPEKTMKDDQQWLQEQTNKLNETFEYFHIRAVVVRVTKGPTVTRFEVQPDPGVKVSKIVSLTDDLKLSLSARDIRIEAPIPGKNTIGVEVPNDVAEPVFLSEILHHPSFLQAKSPLTVAMGMGISGEPVLTDLQKMPHGLIAGSTGSGKSVCVNSILTSILYKASPEEVRLLLIDPKMVELAPFNNVPHLAAPVITDPKEAAEGLKWAVGEMERRYQSFAEVGARDISRYNEKMDRADNKDKKYPYLLIVVDELADLMMVSPQDVEDSICRIAQKARACGIHLLVATQRPSVDVITGLIKANIPTRVAFSVSSQADSRTILDGGGAERLLGKGDMLLLESGSSKPVRIQGTFVSDDEIDRVVEYVKTLPRPSFLFEKEELKELVATEAEDDLFEEACEFILEEQAASASLLQRRFRVGYNRAARLIDDMESRGIVSSSRGSKPRDVYLTKHDE